MGKEAAAVQPSVARIVGQNEGGPNAPADHTPQAHVQTSQSCSRCSQRTQEADEKRLQSKQKEEAAKEAAKSAESRQCAKECSQARSALARTKELRNDHDEEDVAERAGDHHDGHVRPVDLVAVGARQDLGLRICARTDGNVELSAESSSRVCACAQAKHESPQGSAHMCRP